MTQPTAPTATITFDKPVYAPGDLITATITVVAADPAPEPRTISGTVQVSDGSTLTFSGTLAVDGAAPTIVAISATSTGGLSWSMPIISGNTATVTAVAV